MDVLYSRMLRYYEEIDWDFAASGGRIRKRKRMCIEKIIVTTRREKNAI